MILSALKGAESEEVSLVLSLTTLPNEPHEDLRMTQRLTGISARFVRASNHEQREQKMGADV